MKLLYSNDGLSFRDATPLTVDPRDLDSHGNAPENFLDASAIVAAPDEVAFDHDPTEAELLAAFPGRAAALAALAAK